MRTRKRTREIEMALTFRTQDSGPSEQDGEDAEHHDNQRQTADSTD